MNPRSTDCEADALTTTPSRHRGKSNKRKLFSKKKAPLVIRSSFTGEEDMELIYDDDSDCELEAKIEIKLGVMQLSWWLENQGHQNLYLGSTTMMTMIVNMKECFSKKSTA